MSNKYQGKKGIQLSDLPGNLGHRRYTIKFAVKYSSKQKKWKLPIPNLHYNT